MINGYTTSMEKETIALLIQEILESKNPHLRYPLGDFATMRAKARFQDHTGDSYVQYKTSFLKEKSLFEYLGND